MEFVALSHVQASLSAGDQRDLDLFLLFRKLVLEDETSDSLSESFDLGDLVKNEWPKSGVDHWSVGGHWN